MSTLAPLAPLAPLGTPQVFPSIVVAIIAFIVFVIVFNVSWHLSARIFKDHFLHFPLSKKADWCSRVNSTLHGMIIVPGFIASVSLVRWRSDTFEPHNYDDITVVHAFMSVTIAYFFFDLLVILLYRVPMWMVFVTHHIVAIIPIAINVFDTSCPAGSFVLSLFLLVELPTISLNFQVFLEQTGRGDTRLYAVLFYFTYVFWIICRIALPLYLLFVMWNNIYPTVEPLACMAPGFVAAHLIALFCLAVFYFVLTKEVRLRWRTNPKALDVAHVMPGVDGGHTPLSASEASISLTGERMGEEIPEEEVEPQIPSFKPLTPQDLDWGLGIERPASVMRHGGSVMR